MSEVLAAGTEEPCDCGTAMTEFGPLYTNRCLAHCTTDLQLSGVTPALASAVPGAHTLLLPRVALRATWPRRAAPPAAGVPKRIQLHSFLV